MACAGVKKTKQCLTLNDKLEILKIYDSTEGNIKVNELAKTLKISRSTLVTIINNRKTIENAPESDRHRFRTRNRRDNPYAGKSKYQLLDDALADWVRQLQAKGKPFNGVILRNKALELASELGFENFTASNGWSDRFKKKYDFEYKTKPCYCIEQPNLVKKSEINPSHGTVNFLEKIVGEVQQKKPDQNDTAQEQKHGYAEIEEKLMQWLNEAKNEQTKINGILIKEMALTLAGILGIPNFTASSGWLNRFQKKYHLLKYKKCKNCQSTDATGLEASIELDEGEEGKIFNTQSGFRNDKACESSMDDSDAEILVKKKRKLDTEINTELLAKSKRVEHFEELSKKLSKEEEYQKIRLRLDKMEVELDVLNLATELLKVKKINLQLDIENSKIRLQLLECL